MKKILITLSAIAMIFVTSCSNDDNKTNSDANAIETTTVAFEANTTPTTNTTGRAVPRGTIDAKISALHISATKRYTPGNANPGFPPYLIEGDFELVNVAPTPTNGIYLEKVAIGTNDFRALTLAAGPSVFGISKIDNVWTTNPLLIAEANARLAVLKAVTPYAIYSGEVLGKLILKPEQGTSNNVVFPMTTQNGRINSVFILDDTLIQLEYDVTIKATAYTAGGLPIGAVDTTINSGDIASFQWSNLASVNGAKVVYTVTIREAGNNTVLFTYNIPDPDANGTVVGSTSKNCRYLITREQAQVLVTSDDITFTWQPWTNTDLTGKKAN